MALTDLHGRFRDDLGRAQAAVDVGAEGAAFRLAELLEHEGDLHRAATMFRLADETGDVHALFALGNDADQRGDGEEAVGSP